MSHSNSLLILLLYVFHFAAKVATNDGTCDPSFISGRELSGSIDSRRNNSTGEWVTTFGAERTTKGNQTDMNMVVNHGYFECQGKTTVKLQGVIREYPFGNQLETDETVSKSKGDPLRFHINCGTNAKVTNSGKSLEKIQIEKWDDGVAFTNRPLKDDELFEVVLNEKGNVNGNAIGIGVTSHSPDRIVIPRHMNSMKDTWLMYLTNVYKDGSLIKSNFMKDLKEIAVGGRIGVKRTSVGDLHLFINGVDQGVAANSVPSPVYGVFELYYQVKKVTIIDH